MYASLFSHDDTLLYLLEMKADINVKNSTGKTPLMLASLCGSEETVRLLLQVVTIHLSTRSNSSLKLSHPHISSSARSRHRRKGQRLPHSTHARNTGHSLSAGPATHRARSQRERTVSKHEANPLKQPITQ